MEECKIDTLVDRALQDFWCRNSYLLQNELYEVTIAGALMVNLRDHFQEFDVDIEYNRQAKTQNLKRIAPKPLTNPRASDRIRPDIIIHKRGTETNIAAFEIKRYIPRRRSDPTSPDLVISPAVKSDFEKLEQYLQTPYEYKRAYFLGFPIGPDSEMIRLYKKIFYVSGSTI